MAESGSDDHDKTEAPSQRRLDDAFQEGNVAKSAELGTWFVFFGFALSLGTMATSARDLSSILSVFFSHAYDLPGDRAGLSAFASRVVASVGSALAWPILLIIGFALVGSMVQHRFVASLKSVAPQVSRISPLTGFKRIYGIDALINIVKTILKLTIIATALLVVLWPRRMDAARIMHFDPAAILALVHDDVLAVMIAVLIAFGAIAGGDYILQRIRWYNRLKMSRHDLKQEYRQQEGSPEVKQQLRKLRRRFAQQAVRQRVPKATLVVANPTHFAVALQYEEGMNAPLCLAKGIDHLALKIRQLAEQTGVPVIENPPLARALHRLVEIDEEIPLELYKPVAEIIGYVMRLNRSRSGPDARRSYR